ncbi:MAG: flagellin [Syntrophobacteraceae bacterium]
MRITFGMQTSETLINLNNQQETITDLSQEISSGKQLQSPSDNPESWAQAMNANQTVREYNSFISNVNFATGWGQETESALSTLTGLLSQAKQVGIEANSASGAYSNSALAQQMGSILTQALSVANTQYEGQYIFAGAQTATEPYSVDSSGNVAYSGDSGTVQVKTSLNAAGGGMTPVNLAGDAVFGNTTPQSNNILNQIYFLQQAISGGDSTKISNATAVISSAFDNVNAQLSKMGSMVSALSTQSTALSTMVTNEKGVLSNLQDTDMASAATKLSQAQTAYQAALQVTSLLDNLNLSSILSGGAS